MTPFKEPLKNCNIPSEVPQKSHKKPSKNPLKTIKKTQKTIKKCSKNTNIQIFEFFGDIGRVSFFF
jgi:hypothetical protein